MDINWPDIDSSVLTYLRIMSVSSNYYYDYTCISDVETENNKSLFAY